MTVQLQPSTGLRDSIEQRRATRSFRPDPIPEVLLAEILRLATRAPSGYNLQPWRFIVVRDQQNRDKLKACAFNQEKISEAPVVLICCGDRTAGESENIEAVIELGEQTGAIDEAFANVIRTQVPGFFQNSPCFDTLETWTNRHTMLAVAHLMIAAKGFGVDSCPMEGFVGAQVKAAFQIPDHIDVCCIVALGYAKPPVKSFAGRFGLQQVCYGESYGEPFQL